MDLRVLDETFALVRLAAGDAVPAWVGGHDLLAVVRTRNELSIVCRDDVVPNTHTEVQRGWRGVVVVGTLDFTVTGVIARLSTPLADAGISIFGISTYDTDHILFPGDKFEEATAALVAAGHTIR
jgi:hypothetical protein